MAKHKCPECEKCLPGWLVQFGDLMSLLLTFFILLLSMAVMDKKKVEEYFDVMKKAMGFLDANTAVEEQSEKNSTQDSSSDTDSEDSPETTTEEAAQEVAELIAEVNESSVSESDEISIEKGKNEFTLDIPSTIMFEDGEYSLSNPAAKRFISKIARVIRTMPQSFNIEIIGGARTVLGIPKLIHITEIFILVAIVLAALYLLIRSRHGRAIISIREDEIAAEAVGVPTTFYKVYGFVVSAFFAGVAGGALAFYQGLIDPKKFTFMFSVEIFIIVVLGGMGSFTGTVIAAILLGIMNEVLHAVDNWRMVIYALALIAMMIFRPKGIMGTYEFSLVTAIKKYIAKRKQQKTT
jgi:ABC-type uncharacterized transport system permease subunit